MISIIMSVYNGEKYLSDAVHSIMNQTYKDIELILIDDGSTDASRDIEHTLAQEYANIRLYFQCNHGLGYSRNKGVALAEGEWITFFDADDIADERMIEKMYRNALSTNSDISYIQLQDFRTPAPHAAKSRISVKPQKLNSKQAIIQYFQSRRGNVAGGLFRRSLFLHTAFPVGVFYEDNIPKLCVLLKARQIAYSSEPLYFYRNNRKSITGRRMTVKNWDRLWVCYQQRMILRKSRYAHDILLWKEYYSFVAVSLMGIIDNTDLSWDLSFIKKRVPIYYILQAWIACLLKYDRLLRIKCTKVFWKILK